MNGRANTNSGGRLLADFHKMVRLVAVGLFAFIAVGCAFGSFKPVPMHDAGFLDRSVSEYDEDVRVTVAVPNEEEAQTLFDADLAIR